MADITINALVEMIKRKPEDLRPVRDVYRESEKKNLVALLLPQRVGYDLLIPVGTNMISPLFYENSDKYQIDGVAIGQAFRIENRRWFVSLGNKMGFPGNGWELSGHQKIVSIFEEDKDDS